MADVIHTGVEGTCYPIITFIVRQAAAWLGEVLACVADTIIVGALIAIVALGTGEAAAVDWCLDTLSVGACV